MMPPINEGSRPSRLTLDRYATGELSAAEQEAVRTHLDTDPGSRAHLEAIEAARARVAPLDIDALRRRATQLATAPPALPAPANRAYRTWFTPVLLVAAALLVALVSTLGPTPDPHTTVRSADALRVYQLQGNQLHPYAGDVLGHGDVIGFKVNAAGHQSVVILSVDGAGTISVFYPDAQGAPVPLRGDGMVALPGSVVLDAAPGPEVFFAVFDTPVEQARADAARAWQSGGTEGLRDWIARESQVDGVAIERK